MADQQQQVLVKPDPDTERASPMLMDEDVYEDAGDLEFFDTSNQADPNNSTYLARVPPYLWEAWEQLDKLDVGDDTEIRIGTIRQWTDPSGKQRMRLLLAPDRAQHQGLPREYDLDITEPIVKNTFLFTEQDLPGFVTKNKARADAAAQGIPSHLLRQKTERPEQGERPRGKRGPYYRKAIPKKTRIAGRVKHELACNPQANPETEHILNERAIRAMEPKKKTIMPGDGEGRGNVIQAGTNRAYEKFGNFIKTAPPEKTKAKKLEMKTARMPENELLDRIFQCFDRFKYWSMRALRAEIPQPEIYLRTTLERIADLHKSGRFANQWSLKPENLRPGQSAEAGEVPDTGAGGESDQDGDEEEDIKMEDVMTS